VRAADRCGEFGRAACRAGTAIDDYIAHGSVNLQNIRAILVSQRGELLAERYYKGPCTGQLITVVPDLQAVIVISSRASDDPPSIETTSR
jgi:hypothetical protein